MITEPAPRPSAAVSAAAEPPVPEAHVSELAFFRNATVVWSVSFIVLPAISRPGTEFFTQPDTHVPIEVKLSLLAFVGCSLLGAAALAVHRRVAYLAACAIAIAVYVGLLVIHGGFLLLTGASPLEHLYLGDFTGLPAALLQLVLPTWPGLLAALLLIGAGTTFNVALPWDDPGYLLLNAVHGWLALTPFLLFMSRLVSTSRLLDDAAMAKYRAAVQVARSVRLRELEARFLAHLHDKVLADLRSVAAGRMSPAEISTDILTAVSAPPWPVSYLVTRLAGVAGTDTRVDVPERVDRSATIPGPAAAVLLDAAAEALANSRRHAPRASRSMRISVDQGVRVVIEDDGPGFMLSEIPSDRAGVRTSILRSADAAEGVSADIRTSPGTGTAVSLGWSPGTGSPADEERPRGPDLSWCSKIGVEYLLHPLYISAVLVMFFFMAWLSDRGNLWLLIPAAVALVAFSRGSGPVAPAGPAAVSAASVLVLVTGQQLGGGQFPDYWPHAWTVYAAAILLSLLALRGRVLLAWVTLGVLVVLSAARLALTGDVGIPPTLFLAVVTLLAPASVLPWLLDRTVRRIPLLQREMENKFVQLEQTTAQRSYVRDSSAWLRTQVANVRDARTAALMEQRLRDAIRSPLLDVPEITEAVWRARDRGVNVRLIGDRFPAPPDEERHAVLIDTLTTVLEVLKPGDNLTLRLLPAGRSSYATLVTSEPRRISV